ncbi:MAG: UDP-Glc:alpha-D-GlcNAc-diphosphoundecaprenol beta-1,3-glucosyltransferase WfgD [Alphaproteobacteria bacterium MarineAlpha9_Bin4]|nr:MAG: UDP-Glc:alpha-D-GlcNAc-diphosphoundecaprenol beta-1,3-glucosyltransferase WfgD [Alphaproteobacteria bacterium MarineAlpha9_Bin4]
MQFIENTIKSVLEQSYKVDEIIVVDNNSTDNTCELVKNKFPNVRLLRENQQGVSYARNTGINNAKNNWIAFLDSDDQWLRNKIELQVNKVKSHNYNSLFVHTDEIWIKNGKKINQKKKHMKLEGYIYKECLNMCIISPSSVLVNRHLFNEYGMFRPWLKVCEDYELWLRFTSKVPIYLVNVPCVVKYGGHPGQLSKKHWGIDRFRVRALEKLILRFNLNKIQTKDTTNALISKIKVIISGAEKRKNKKIMKIYNFKKNYWKDKI